MKKLLSIALALLMFAFVLTGCAKANDAASQAASDAVSDAVTAAENGDSAEAAKAAEAAVEDVQQNGADSDTTSAFYSAYMEAKSAVLTPLMDALGNNPDTMMSAMSFLGVTMSDLYLLPAMYFGLGETSVATALAMMGAKDVTYNEQGNQYTVTYKDSNEKTVTLTGTYEKGKSLVTVGSTDGTENVFAETYRTAFGYVGQFYIIADDGTASLYQVSVSGKDGVFGIVTGEPRPAPLAGNEPADFPKSAKEWYAISGNNVTGMTSDGKSISFTYVPSESN